MEFLEIPLFDDDFFKMLVRFALNFAFISIIIRQLYYRYTQRTEYVFTYYMVSIIVFFLCFTLKKLELDLGMALGLFAIFGIIRYRTLTVDIKEMTYLFVVIGVSLINALANKKMSYTEILTVNIAVVGAIYVIERYVLSKAHVEQRNITYGTLENIKPENYDALMDDLKDRTGLNITKVSVTKVDYANQVSTLIIYYKVVGRS
ncbi:MAG: DUF4956 domain-containing protein [Roseivirga sp.]